MRTKQHLKIGILGGMGPQAGAELVRIIIDKAIAQGAVNCEEFPEIILDSIPVPDFIDRKTNLVKVSRMLSVRAKMLRESGCNPVVMACNTAHIMEKPVRKAAGGAFRSLLGAVAQESVKRNMKRVCVLASPLTIRTDLYKNTLRTLGIAVVYPDKKNQILLEDIIRRVIAGERGNRIKQQVLDIARREMERGQADGVILGCTELPVATGILRSAKIINSLEILAQDVLGSGEKI